MPDDHSEVVPLLPIPNRTVKRLRANDSAGSRVKVGHRQALTALNAPPDGGAFLSALTKLSVNKNQNFDVTFKMCVIIEGFAAFLVDF